MLTSAEGSFLGNTAPLSSDTPEKKVHGISSIVYILFICVCKTFFLHKRYKEAKMAQAAESVTRQMSQSSSSLAAILRWLDHLTVSELSKTSSLTCCMNLLT